MTRTRLRRRERRENARGDAADWRLAEHDFHLAVPHEKHNEPRPYPVAIPRGGPLPTEPAAERFLPLASPAPTATQALCTAAALETFGFGRLQQAVLACRRRERGRPRMSAAEHDAAIAVATRIEQLASKLSTTMAHRIEVSFDSPRGLPTPGTGGASARIRLRIDANPSNGRHPPLGLDVDPLDPLVNPKINTGSTRVDIAPPGLGRLARIAATNGAGFRPPAPTAEILIAAARARNAGPEIRVRTRAVDDSMAVETRTVNQEELVRLLLAHCWPRLTPDDGRSTWIIHLSKATTHPSDPQSGLNRNDRATGSVMVNGEQLGAADGEALTALVSALRMAGRKPAGGYWTDHRTPYLAGVKHTGQ